MEKCRKIIIDMYRCVVVFFSTIMVTSLIIISCMSICFVSSDELEITYFCNDNRLINTLIILLIFTIAVLVATKDVVSKFSHLLSDDIVFIHCRSILLAIIFVLGIVWVLLSQVVPGSDQLDVLDSAYKLRYGITNMLEPGGYLDKWRNQLGITIIHFYLGKIFGDFNITGLQLLNCVGLVLLYKKIVDIMALLNISRVAQIGTLINGVIFYPMIMYTAFVYGNIWSVALALLAFFYEIKFLREGRIYHLISSGVIIGIAIQVKNNVLIFMIAMVIYAIVYTIKYRTKTIGSIALILMMILSFMIMNRIPGMIVEAKTGVKLEQGVSSWSFIAMGLQNEGHNPGWSNGYNYSTYADSGYNTLVHEQMAKANIAESVALFKSNKHYAFEFFTKKIASMWTEPTYQSFWICQIRNHRVDYPQWLIMFLGAKGYTVAAKILGGFQIVIFLGCLMWLLLEDKELFLERSFFIVIVIGGFLFHLFWEAKSQYSITYVVLMIPMAIMGYELLVTRIHAGIVLGNDSKASRNIIRRFKISVYPLVIFTFFSITFLELYLYNGSGFLTADTEEYSAYVESFEAPYLNESVRDINIIKAERDYYRGY